MVLNLQATVTSWKTATDAMNIELKQALENMAANIKKQDETIKLMMEEIKFVKHTCTYNSSRSTSPESYSKNVLKKQLSSL